MVLLHSALTASLAVLSLHGSTQAASFADRLRDLSLPARDVLRRTTPAAPHFVVYSDKYVTSKPAPSDINGFNVFALSFLLTTGSADQAQEWQTLPAYERTAILDEYNAAGISLIVSLFGSTETPTSSGYDATTTANTMSAWVREYGVLGVDVDYEDFPAFDSGTGSAELWLQKFTAELRTQLPQGQYILTHAPAAPWFSPDMWRGGGYLRVNEVVGSMIDWYNVQFYNQGTTEYTTCDGLLYHSSENFPESALFQISASGVILDKLVIGKPAIPSDASNGYMDTTLLASCVAEAHAAGWSAGVMVWEYPDAASSWITAVRGNTWPVSSNDTGTSPEGAASPGTSPKSAASPGTPGNCASTPTWQINVPYVSGERVAYNGNLWAASYWNEDSAPGGPAGAWEKHSGCT